MNTTPKRQTKVYLLKIDKNAAKSGKWYADKIGELFHAVLICKKIGESVVPRFLVITEGNGRYYPYSGQILIIDPLHVYALHEEAAEGEEVFQFIKTNTFK